MPVIKVGNRDIFEKGGTKSIKGERLTSEGGKDDVFRVTPPPTLGSGA